MVESMKARRRRRKHEQWAAEEKAKKVEAWDLKYKSLTIQELYKVKSTITGRDIELYGYLENLIIDREFDLPIEIPKIDLHKQKLAQILTVKVPIKPEIIAKPLGITPTLNRPVVITSAIQNTEVIPNTPPIFTGFRDAKNYYMPKEKTWLEKLINWIKNLLNLT